MKPRILIVDDHEIVREGVRSLLNKMRPAWEICGEAVSGNEAVDAVKALEPTIVILDITMPGLSGLEAAARINKLGAGCRVLMFTMHESDRLGDEVRDAGAQGFVLKSRAARDLILAIESIATGGTFFGSLPIPEPKGDDESNRGNSVLRCLGVSRLFDLLVSGIRVE